MTEGEKLVWAAAFACDWRLQHRDNHRYGTPVHVATAVENAWAAVQELRGVRRVVVEGWGADSPVVAMLEEMLKGGV